MATTTDSSSQYDDLPANDPAQWRDDPRVGAVASPATHGQTNHWQNLQENNPQSTQPQQESTLNLDDPLSYERVRFHAPAVFTFDGYDETFEAAIINLSSKGLACLGPKGLIVGDKVRLSFRLHLAANPVHLLCSLVWSKLKNNKEAYYGFRFVELSAFLQQTLRDCVKERSEGLSSAWTLPMQDNNSKRSNASSLLDTLNTPPFDVETTDFPQTPPENIITDSIHTESLDNPQSSIFTTEEQATTSHSFQKTSLVNTWYHFRWVHLFLGLALGLVALYFQESLGNIYSDSRVWLESHYKGTTQAIELQLPESPPEHFYLPADLQAQPQENLKIDGFWRMLYQLTGLRLEEKPNKVALTLWLDGPVDKHGMFWLEKPSRLVVDVLGRRSRSSEKIIHLDHPLIQKIRIGHHAKKVRFVIETNPRVQNQIKTIAVEDGLRLELEG